MIFWFWIVDSRAHSHPCHQLPSKIQRTANYPHKIWSFELQFMRNREVLSSITTPLIVACSQWVGLSNDSTQQLQHLQIWREEIFLTSNFKMNAQQRIASWLKLHFFVTCKMKIYILRENYSDEEENCIFHFI